MPFPNTLPQDNPVPSQINTSSAHTDPAWRKAALAIVKRLARKRETFTSADVLERLDNSEVKTRDLRAVGCVMVQARNLGIISNAGLVRRSNKHSRGATTLWRSLLFPSDQQSSEPSSSSLKCAQRLQNQPDRHADTAANKTE
jgi:hypothetical protein